jgi:hypothetical protein
MSNEWVVRVSEDGDIQTLWHDALDLEDLGHCTVERLTNVEYVDDAWQISYARNNCPMTQKRFAKRADALAAEQRIVFAFWQNGGGSF